MTSQDDLEGFERRLSAVFARVPSPRAPWDRAAEPRRRRLPWAGFKLAAALTIAVLLGSLYATGHSRAIPPPILPEQGSAVWHGDGLTITTRGAAARLSCPLPVSVLATGSHGFIDFSGGSASFQRAPGTSGSTTYVPAFHSWLNVLPQMVAPDGQAYATETASQSSPSVQIVRADGPTLTWPVKRGDSIFGWSQEGVIITAIPRGSFSPTLQVWLMDPSTGALRAFPFANAMQFGSPPRSGETGYLPAADAFWMASVNAGETTLVAQSLKTAAVQTWYRGPGYAYVVGATSSGSPIVQVGARDLGHLQPNQQKGVFEQVLLLTAPGKWTVLNRGAVTSPGVAAGLSPLSWTAGGTVWMADDRGGIWTYAAQTGMRQVAKITTSNDGPPGVSISGGCG